MNLKEIGDLIMETQQGGAKLEAIRREAVVEGLRLELLAQLVINTNEIVMILRSQQPGAQLELPLSPPVPVPIPVEEPKVAPVEEPKVAPVVAKKKAPVAKAAPVAEVAPVAEAKALTKDEVMSALIDFIGNHEDGEEAGEEALGVILKELGNFTQFPEVPADKYADLLAKINQA